MRGGGYDNDYTLKPVPANAPIWSTENGVPIRKNYQVADMGIQTAGAEYWLYVELARIKKRKLPDYTEYNHQFILFDGQRYRPLKAQFMVRTDQERFQVGRKYLIHYVAGEGTVDLSIIDLPGSSGYSLNIGTLLDVSELESTSDFRWAEGDEINVVATLDKLQGLRAWFTTTEGDALVDWGTRRSKREREYWNEAHRELAVGDEYKIKGLVRKISVWDDKPQYSIEIRDIVEA